MAEILIIDDNLVMRKNIKSIVENLGHKVVKELETGTQIIDNYEEHQPDIVTLDIVMPGIGGMEALKRLKDKFPEAKVIMVSVLGEKSKIIRAIKLGAEYYIQKPIEVKIMSKAIDEALYGVGANDRCKNKSLTNNLEEDIKDSLREELITVMNQNSSDEDLSSLEDKIENLSLDETSTKPIEVKIEDDAFKINVNHKINQRVLDIIDDSIKGLFIVESLKIVFDLSEIEFVNEEVEEEFGKIVKKIEIIGGEVETIST